MEEYDTTIEFGLRCVNKKGLSFSWSLYMWPRRLEEMGVDMGLGQEDIIVSTNMLVIGNATGVEVSHCIIS